jgi:hypothetical protein
MENLHASYFELEEMVHNATVLPHNNPAVIEEINSALDHFRHTFFQV